MEDDNKSVQTSYDQVAEEYAHKYLNEFDEMEGYLQVAGFVIEHVTERPPYPNVEAQTHRVYIFARKPA